MKFQIKYGTPILEDIDQHKNGSKTEKEKQFQSRKSSTTQTLSQH